MQRSVDGSPAEPRGCLDEQEAVDFAAGIFPAAQLPILEQHLAGCERCAGLIAAAAPHIDVTTATRETRSIETQPFGPRPTRPSSNPGQGRERPLLDPGTALDATYQVVGFLGRGGMGDVYEVKHARLAGRYAAKLLSSDLADNSQAFSRFQREATIASGLNHPHIVNVIDFCHVADGRPCLVMEFLDGQDLAQVMAIGQLSWARTLRLVRQIVSALGALHNHQIIHRDLKPQNIFVLPGNDDEPERIKLVDFGLAKRSKSSVVVTNDRTLLGTPQYMAPEQAIGNSDSLGPEADQFSLAAIVYEMLGGRHPFTAEVLSTVLYRIVHEPPPPLGALAPHVPPHVIAAIERALAKDKNARFPSVKAFLQALEGDGSAMTPALTTKKQRRSWFIRREVLASAGVLAVTIGIVAYVRTRAPGQDPELWRASGKPGQSQGLTSVPSLQKTRAAPAPAAPTVATPPETSLARATAPAPASAPVPEGVEIVAGAKAPATDRHPRPAIHKGDPRPRSAASPAVSGAAPSEPESAAPAPGPVVAPAPVAPPPPPILIEKL